MFLGALVPVADVQGAPWKDPSPHTVRFVEVEPGVRLELLDWGGSGEPIVLLAGHGQTGHVFDDFAPPLARDFRVVAITRRGFGASSQPDHGYDLPTLVNDIAQVAEALKLERPHLVGHSIAGDEMTRYAITYPGKVGKLVFLDAAYDRVYAQKIEAGFPRLPPPTPAAEAAMREAGSADDIRSIVAKTSILLPRAEIRATRAFDAKGRFVGPVTPDRILVALAKSVEYPDYAAVRAPMFAIYAVPQTPAQLVPSYELADPARRKVLEEIFEIWKTSARTQREAFRSTAPRACVDEIEGASHYVFISHPERVLKDIRKFLGRAEARG